MEKIRRQDLMLLPGLRVTKQKFFNSDYYGMDSYKECQDKEHFKNFPYIVNYSHNSRGFRDTEWPNTLEELKNSIWCIGDSFTVGLGSPIEHTWVKLLEKKINKKCINISLSGASNSWISRNACSILSEIQPKFLVVHWSFWHRIENKNSNHPDDYEQLHYDLNQIDEDTKTNNFLSCFNSVESFNDTSTIIHSFIPFWNYPLKDLNSEWNKLKGSNWPVICPRTLNEYMLMNPEYKLELHNAGFTEENNLNYIQIYEKLNKVNYIPEFEVSDKARDGFHYGYQTADYFSNLLISELRNASEYL